MKKKICFGAKRLKKHMKRHFRPYLFGTVLTVALVKALVGILSLSGIQQDFFFHSSAASISKFLNYDDLQTFSDEDIISTLFPVKITDGTYTQFWDQDIYTEQCGTKFSIVRLDPSKTELPSFASNTVYILPEGVNYTIPDSKDLPKCSALIGEGEEPTKIFYEGPDYGLNVSFNTIVQNVSILGTEGFSTHSIYAIDVRNVTFHQIQVANVTDAALYLLNAYNIYIHQSQAYNATYGFSFKNSNIVRVDNSMAYNNSENGMIFAGGDSLAITNSALFNNAYGVRISDGTDNVVFHDSLIYNNSIAGLYFASSKSNITLNNIGVFNNELGILNDANTTYYGSLELYDNIKNVEEKTSLRPGKDHAFLANGVSYLEGHISLADFINPYTDANVPLLSSSKALSEQKGPSSFSTNGGVTYLFGDDVYLQTQPLVSVLGTMSLWGREGVEYVTTDKIAYYMPRVPFSWNYDDFLDVTFWDAGPTDPDIAIALFSDTPYTSQWSDNKCDPSKMIVQYIYEQKDIETLFKTPTSNTIYVFKPNTYLIPGTVSLNSLSCVGFVGEGTYGDVKLESTQKEIFRVDSSSYVIFDNLRINGTDNSSFGVFATKGNNLTFNNGLFTRLKSAGILFDSFTYFIVNDVHVTNSQGVGFAVENVSSNGTFNNIDAYNNKVSGININQSSYIAISNSNFTNALAGINITVASNVILHNSVMAFNSEKGLSLNEETSRIYLNNVYIYSNEVGYTNNSKDTSILFYGIDYLFDNKKDYDANVINLGGLNFVFDDGIVKSDEVRDLSWIINARNSELKYLYDVGTPDSWVGQQGFIMDTVTYRYGESIPQQLQPVGYAVDKTYDFFGDEDVRYFTPKYITEKDSPLAITLVPEEPESVCSLQKDISYQIKSPVFPVSYTLKGDIDEDGQVGTFDSPTGTLSVNLKDYAGKHDIQITVTTADPKDESTDTVQFIYECADLAITKTSDTASVIRGDKIGYTIAYLNNGPFDAYGVQIEEILPPGLEFSDANVMPKFTGTNYTGVYGVVGDLCYQDLLNEKGSYMDALNIWTYTTYENDPDIGGISNYYDLLTYFGAYNGAAEEFGEWIYSLCSSGISYTSGSLSLEVASGSTFEDCLSSLAHIDITAIPMCGVTNQHYLVENDMCYASFLKEEGDYMKTLDKYFYENGGYESTCKVLNDSASEYYDDFITFTDGSQDCSQAIEFLQDYYEQNNSTFRYELITTFGYDFKNFADCGAEGYTTYTFDIGDVSVGKGGTIILTLASDSKLDNGTILTNRARIYTSTHEEGLDDNLTSVDVKIFSKVIEIGDPEDFDDKAEISDAILFTVANGGIVDPVATYVTDLPIDFSEDTLMPVDFVHQSASNSEFDPTAGFVETLFTEGTNLSVAGDPCELLILPPSVEDPTRYAASIPSWQKVITVVHLGLSCPNSTLNFTIPVTLRVYNPALEGTVEVMISSDGITWTKLDSVKVENNRVQISANHFSYYAFGTPPTPVVPITSGGGTHHSPLMDDCLYDSTSSHNLPGANDDGEDFSDSYYDGTCEGLHSAAITALCDEGNEFRDAYDFAYDVGITSATNCSKANLDTLITRAEAAKMLSMFAKGVLGKTPESIKTACSEFVDIDKYPSLEGYIQTACNLGLMGYHSDGTMVNDHFYPNQYITRAMLGTIVSRLLLGEQHNAPLEDYVNGSDYWYKDHLAAMKDYGIMTNISNAATTKELRGWVMIVLYRAKDVLLTHSLK